MMVSQLPVRAALLAALVGLSACGGGGVGGSPPSPPPPPPPATLSFISPTTVSTPESRMAPFYTVTTTSTAGNVQFQAAGGADAARFVFEPANVGSASANGTLRFAAFPDFESPADANGDNVYEYQFRATDASGVVVTHTLQVTVTNVTGGFRVREVYNSPVNTPACPCRENVVAVIGVPDSSGRVAVVQHGGVIRYLNATTGALAATPMLDVSAVISASTRPDDGLLGLAYSPTFAADRTFYIYLHTSAQNVEIRRYQVQAANRDVADTATADVIYTLSLDDFIPGTPPRDGTASAGLFTFDKNGVLVIGTSDAGDEAENNPRGGAGAVGFLTGKVLRINPAGDDYPTDPNRDFSIPAGNYTNPFGTLVPETYAAGLQRPKGSIDSLTGDLFMTDQGYLTTSEINRLPATTPQPPGGIIHFGWYQMEGSRAYAGPATPGLNPAGEVLAQAGQKAKIGGAVVYRGPATQLQGQFLFNGPTNIYSYAATSVVQGANAQEAAYTNRNNDFYASGGLLSGATGPDFYGEDQAGNVYLIQNIGRIFRIEAAD